MGAAGHMSATAQNRYADSLTGSWLAERLAIDPLKIEAMRRAGELIAVREPGSGDWHYPAWQFEPEAAARRRPHRRGRARGGARRDAPVRRHDVPARADGQRKLADLLVEGRDDEVIAAVGPPAPSRQSRGCGGAHDRDVAAHRLDLEAGRPTPARCRSPTPRSPTRPRDRRDRARLEVAGDRGRVDPDARPAAHADARVAGDRLELTSPPRPTRSSRPRGRRERQRPADGDDARVAGDGSRDERASTRSTPMSPETVFTVPSASIAPTVTSPLAVFTWSCSDRAELDVAGRRAHGHLAEVALDAEVGGAAREVEVAARRARDADLDVGRPS